MTSFEKNTSDPLVSPESKQAYEAYLKGLTDPTSKKVRLHRQNLLATSALAHGRMLRETDIAVEETSENIIGYIDVEQ